MSIQLSQAKGSRVATDIIGNVSAAERFVSASGKKKGLINLKSLGDLVKTYQVLG